LKLFNHFKKAGLIAVLGIGAAPGITNVLSRYAYDQLDQVKVVDISFGAEDMTDRSGIDAFVPPYSIATIMEEFSYQPVEFIDGEYRTFRPFSGAKEIIFPEPIGRRTCVYTLHSEPATIPNSFKDKGVRQATWRLGLPPEFEEKIKLLILAGLARDDPVKVQGVEVARKEVLAEVIEKNYKEKLKGVNLKLNEVACIRSQVTGEKEGGKLEYTVDCIIRTHSRGTSYIVNATGVPASIVAQMQAKGMIKEPGVWGPEKVIDPEYFFKELARREMQVRVTIKKI